ncbi:Uncharacterised protein [Mycobacteroides abscessus subsp. massiliense]|nr:Uncharacterised protein [Mycobacteroides abscessus subsp. massiliense]
MIGPGNRAGGNEVVRQPAAVGQQVLDRDEPRRPECVIQWALRVLEHPHVAELR